MTRPNYRPNLLVSSVWYEQATAGHVELGLANIRITTGRGHFSRTVRLGLSSLDEARSIARGLEVDLVIAHDLRELVAGWEGRGEAVDASASVAIEQGALNFGGQR